VLYTDSVRGFSWDNIVRVPCPLSASDKMSVIVRCHADVSANFGNGPGHISCPGQFFFIGKFFLHPNLKKRFFYIRCAEKRISNVCHGGVHTRVCLTGQFYIYLLLIFQFISRIGSFLRFISYIQQLKLH
jgi:hypothetical protein